MSATAKEVILFTPLSVPNCVLWMDGADSTTMTFSSSNIQTWNDKSSNAYSVAPLSGNASPILSQTFNGTYPAVLAADDGRGQKIMGSTETISATSVQGISGLSYFVVGQFINGSSLVQFEETGVPGTRIIDLEMNYTYARIDYNTENLITPNDTITTPFIGCVTYDTNAENISWFFNGSPSSNVQQGPCTLNYSSGYEFFGQSSGTNPTNGYIAEYIGYSQPLSSDERQGIEGYLAWKWGLVSLLPTTHPYFLQRIYVLPPFPLTVLLPNKVTKGNTFTLNVKQPVRKNAQRFVWLPKKISSLVLWLDAKDSQSYTLSANSTLTAWNDKSGVGNNTYGILGSPELTINPLNKYPGVNFNGTSTQISVPLVVTTNWSIFVLLSTSQINPNIGANWWAGQGIFDAEIGGTVSDFGCSLIGTIFCTGIGVPPSSDLSIYSTTPISSASGAVFICNYNRTTSTGLIENWVNATLQSKAIGPTTTRSAPTRITIGSIQTSVQTGFGYLNGTIYEIVVFSQFITAGQRQQVEGYLAWKWGLVASLPSGHPYKLFPPSP